MDTNVLPDETLESPTQDISEGGRQGSADGTQTLDALKKEIQSLKQVVTGLQSGKDRGVDRLQKEVNDLKSRYESYKSLRDDGMSHEQAERQLELDELLAERRRLTQGQAATGQQGAVGNRPAGASGFDAMPLLNEYGIPDDDPEVVQMATDGRLNNPAEVTRLLVRRSSAQPKPGQLQSSPGGSPAKEDLAQQYQADLAVAQKQGQRAVLELRRKYRQKGLNI